ncbi:MAG: hypothetical protein ACRYFU_04750 [Janthinobacterium lividum]
MIVQQFQSWLILLHRRILWAFAASLVFTLLMHMWITAESPTDFGVFWHHFCGCPVDRDDLRVLLNFPIIFGLAGFLLGVPPIQLSSIQAGTPAHAADTRFLFTRPVSRATTLFMPLALATAAIAVLPTLAIVLLLGWLRLVQAPSLAYLLATLQQIPAVAALGSHPTLLATLSALHMTRRYAASVTLGLCAYTATSCQRWLILSPRKTLKVLGALPAFLPFFPVDRIFGGAAVNYLLMTPGRDGSLGVVPSTLTVFSHLAFAAAVVAGCWRLVSTTEV